MQGLNTKLNPLTILGIWIVSMIVLTPVFMVIANIGASGGEQKPLTTLSTMIVVTIYGAAVLSILTPFLFRKWFKRNWWFSFIILATVVPVTRLIEDGTTKDSYSFSETFKEINGNTILTKTEFYNGSSFEKIRSIRFFKNNKKDSTWITYSDKGEVIKKVRYRNDTLISK